MKNVEIYDQYSNVYLDNTTNELVKLDLTYNEKLDTDRYTIVHSSSSFVETKYINLNLDEALNTVNSLYLESQKMGINYEDKMIRLEEGYAELIIEFSDGKILNRVIYIKDNL
jgi:hypothetical protein